MVRCSTKENPSDLGTEILEKEAMTSCINKLAIVPYTCFEKSHRSGSHVGEQCQQSDNRSHQDGLLGAGRGEFHGQDEED